PFLEFEKARRLGVYLRIDVIVLFPKGVRGVQILEIGHERCAVKDAVAEIAAERSQPGAAEKSAEVAHRVLAVDTGPIGERRAREQDRPDQVRPTRAHHHDLPSRLTIADEAGLAFGLRVKLGDLLDKTRFGTANVLDRLARHRLRQKADE